MKDDAERGIAANLLIVFLLRSLLSIPLFYHRSPTTIELNLGFYRIDKH